MTEVQRLAKIMILKDMRKEYELRAKYNGGVDYDCYRALDMAIVKLEQESCTDAISRQAVLDILDDMVKDYINENDFDKAQGIAWVKVQRLSSVSLKEPCEMTAEEYRQRMIQAFHNADTDELIAICVLPTEKEFEFLEWLLKNHYKKEPCTDAISRQAVLDLAKFDGRENLGSIIHAFDVEQLSPVTPAEKVGQWVFVKGYEGILYECTVCKNKNTHTTVRWNYCPHCGAKMASLTGAEEE